MIKNNIVTVAEEPEEQEEYYYALLNDNDVVLRISLEPIPIERDNLVPLDSYDTSVIGKWYDRANSTPGNPIFTDRPFWTTYTYLADDFGVKGYNDGSLQNYLDYNFKDIREHMTGTITGTYEGNAADIAEFDIGEVDVFSAFISRTDTNALYMMVAGVPLMADGEEIFSISPEGKVRAGGVLNEEGVTYTFTIFGK